MTLKFTAQLLDGRILTSEDVASVSLLPLAEVVELSVAAPGTPAVVLRADVGAGERVHCFVRHSLPVGNPELAKISVPVYEIRKNDTVLCRLYWPDTGPILTSRDLYF